MSWSSSLNLSWILPWEQVIGKLELPPPSKNWKKDLRGCAISAYKMMITHHWLAQEWNRGKPGPAKNSYHECILRIMHNAQFSEDLACQGVHAVTMHVLGFALQVIKFPFSDMNALRKLAQEQLDTLSDEEYPNLRAHVQYHLDGRDQRNDFKFMLDLILDGLEADLANQPKA